MTDRESLAHITEQIRRQMANVNLAANLAYHGPHGTKMRRRHYYAQDIARETALIKRAPVIERLLRKAARLRARIERTKQ